LFPFTPPEAEFVSDFMGASELHGIKNRIFRVEEKSREGCLLKDVIASQALYIADGHHRYHASLLNQQLIVWLIYVQLLMLQF